MKKAMLIAAAIVVLALVGILGALAAGGFFKARGEERLKVGDAVPDVALPLDDGSALKLREQKRPMVVYFYPKDDTPGCTKEACEFRDKTGDLEKSGALVVGISFDAAESHKEFKKKYRIPFPLATDSEDGKLAAAFNVPVRTLGPLRFHARDTIVVGADGKVRAVLRGVDPVDHVDEVLAAIGAAPAKAAGPVPTPAPAPDAPK